MAARSARQVAAAKRNIKIAQAASARSRKGKSKSAASGHHYGTGRQGRKATRLALYGSKKHGISPTQYARRRQRANKWKGRAALAASVALTGATLYASMPPQQRAALKNKVRDHSARAKTHVQYRVGAYKMHRQIKNHLKKR